MYILSNQVLSIIYAVQRSRSRSMLKEKITGFIDQLKSIDGVAACALVSRDGIIVGKYFDRELNEPWFGALSATILASAESVGSIIRLQILDSVTIQAKDTSIIVMGAGENFLVAAITRDGADTGRVQGQIYAVTQQIGETI
jgi:hypothetical protein